MNLKKHVVLFAGIFFCTYLMAQRSSEILSVSASVNAEFNLQMQQNSD